MKRLWNYYNGQQDILNKFYADPSKPCNKVVVNYCSDITANYQGYLTGKKITYSSTEDISDIQEVLNYNDVASEDSELLKQALIYGVGYEICWIDEDKKQRFNVIDAKSVIPVYYNSLDEELAAVIRFYQIEDSNDYFIEVYEDEGISYYKSGIGFSSMELIEYKENYYNQIPITVFKLNEERKSIFEPIMGLQDAYNRLVSAEVDDYEAFVDAYLVLKGMNVDPEVLPDLRKNRVLDVGENGSAEFLAKNLNDSQIENILTNIENKIHTISHSPDFSQESFGTSSGIALRHRLLGFENAASAIEKNFIKALQKRIELICSIVSLVNGGEEIWRDINIIVEHNLPIDLTDIANTVNNLRGLVSDKTLLSLIPFVSNVDAEYEAIQEQNKANNALYSFDEE